VPDELNTIAATTAEARTAGERRAQSRTNEKLGSRGEITRMVGVDFARFLAIIGMFCAHLMTTRGQPGYMPWLTSVVEGNASTLFAVVGGVSVVFATRSYLERGYVAAARWAMLARGLLVILIGMTLALAPGNVVVVLVYFGVAMLCTIPFLRIAPKWLLVSASILALVGPIANANLRAVLGVMNEGGGIDWTQWGDPTVALRAVFLTGTYPVVTWLVYLLVGMAFAKRLVAAVGTATELRFLGRTAGLGALLAAFALVTSSLIFEAFGRSSMVAAMPGASTDMMDTVVEGPGFGAPFSPASWALALQTPHTGATLDIVRGVGIALVVIATMLLLARTLPKPVLRILEPVRAAGAAPLTVYVLHVLAASAAVNVLLMATPPPTAIPWWYLGPAIVACHVLGAIAVGALLAALKRRGPLEACVSGLSGAVARSFGGVTAAGPHPQQTGERAARKDSSSLASSRDTST